MASKKVVVKLTFQDDKSKQKPLNAVSSIDGIVSMSLDGDKITVIGEVDPVQVVKKLRKWYPQLDTVGPAKEEKKDGKAAGGGGAKEKEVNEQIAKLVAYPMSYNPHYYTQPYPLYVSDENPNSCVIC